MITNGAASTMPGSAPTRAALAQSTATSTRSAEVGRTLAPEPALVQLQEPVLAGERRRPTEEHHDVLAELAERESHREERAERVAVRRLVRGDGEALVARGGRP